MHRRFLCLSILVLAAASVRAQGLSTPDSSGQVTATESSRLEAALTSMKSLREAVQIGFLRDRYSETVIPLLLPVISFSSSTSADWADVRLAMRTAVEHFRAPLDYTAAWADPSHHLTQAGIWSDRAAALASDHTERTRTEQPVDISLSLDSHAVTGRLGFGDTVMPHQTDASTSGALNDRYLLKWSDRSKQLIVTMTCTPCTPHLTLTRADGRQVDGDMGSRGISAIAKKGLAPGDYVIWAGTIGSHTGDYSLSVSAN